MVSLDLRMALDQPVDLDFVVHPAHLDLLVILDLPDYLAKQDRLEKKESVSFSVT